MFIFFSFSLIQHPRPFNSTNGASHEKQELQFNLPPVESVDPPGLHPAGVWEDGDGARH